MTRSEGDMTSPRCLLTLISALSLIACSHGGPLGPLPNVTSTDVELTEGKCSVGEATYSAGQEFQGSSPCERCTCSVRGVQCAQMQCEPRPGCKALHRPDHCCPTYQCECEQEGRVYGNGEKLVDPHDPCRVCYCQGGEVVCRRIACFVRDDCTPRLVPGRCCPEYDNCPLRGVTSLPGMTPAPSLTPVNQEEIVPPPPKENEPKITIKEITPVSEIPIITNVKIKEIMPSSSKEVAEYSSSKSPLITREATSEKTSSADQTKLESETPSVIEVHATEITSSEVKSTDKSKGVEDAPPSKISLSTQDSINSEIYPSNVPFVATMGVPAAINNAPAPVATTHKPTVIEDEDPSLFTDHNPAFPPIPDDFLALSNHGDELVPEPSADTDHIPIDLAPTPEIIIASVTPSTESEKKELLTTTITSKYLPDTSVTTTERLPEITAETSTMKLEIPSTDAPVVKENPKVKLRSAIPTETHSVPSEEARTSHEVITTTIVNEPLSTVTSTTTAVPTVTTTTTTTTTMVTSTTTEPTSTMVTSNNEHASTSTPVLLTEGSKSIEDMSIDIPKKLEENTEEPKISKKLDYTTEEPFVPKSFEEFTTDEPETPVEKVSFFVTSTTLESDMTTKVAESSTVQPNSTSLQLPTTSSIPKSNVATEVTSQTELSSLPIETSDQNPHEASENVSKETDVSSTTLITTEKFSSPSSEKISVKNNENGENVNVETTEFVLSLGSSESATDAVELIKISGDSDKSAAFIDSSDGNKNALTDLIKLVSDVASISEHTETRTTTVAPIASTTTVDSEELIPVNAGYKSKNSNFNQNSITEVPSFKSKSGTPTNKQKIVEIEDDEEDSITDSPPPNDKVEPTTRRPIIDNVSDDMPEVKTEKKDIEIITQSYVPTINRRPTKVILQEKSLEDATGAATNAATDAASNAATDAATNTATDAATNAATDAATNAATDAATNAATNAATTAATVAVTAGGETTTATPAVQ